MSLRAVDLVGGDSLGGSLKAARQRRSTAIVGEGHGLGGGIWIFTKKRGEGSVGPLVVWGRRGLSIDAEVDVVGVKTAAEVSAALHGRRSCELLRRRRRGLGVLWLDLDEASRHCRPLLFSLFVSFVLFPCVRV